MLKELFESLDKEIFKPELVESLQVEFDKTVNEAVEAKVLISEAETKEKLVAENEIVIGAEKERLVVEAEEKFVAFKGEVSEKLNSYLEIVVEEIVKDNEIALSSEEEKGKVSAMIEAFSGFMITAGVDVAKINEAKETDDVEAKLVEQVAVNNALVEENISVKAQNLEFLKMGVINEMKEGLSIVESEKFSRLSELVEFTNDDAFATKLETLKESVKGVPVKEAEKPLEEAVKPVKCSFAHLV